MKNIWVKCVKYSYSFSVSHLWKWELHDTFHQTETITLLETKTEFLKSNNYSVTF